MERFDLTEIFNNRYRKRHSLYVYDECFLDVKNFLLLDPLLFTIFPVTSSLFISKIYPFLFLFSRYLYLRTLLFQVLDREIGIWNDRDGIMADLWKPMCSECRLVPIYVFAGIVNSATSSEFEKSLIWECGFRKAFHWIHNIFLSVAVCLQTHNGVQLLSLLLICSSIQHYRYCSN